MLCGGNIDTTVLGRSLERGLAADGRLVRFSVHLMDWPGTLSELTSILKDHKASIKDIVHERTWLDKDKSVYFVQVRHSDTHNTCIYTPITITHPYLGSQFSFLLSQKTQLQCNKQRQQRKIMCEIIKLGA